MVDSTSSRRQTCGEEDESAYRVWPGSLPLVLILTWAYVTLLPLTLIGQGDVADWIRIYVLLAPLSACRIVLQMTVIDLSAPLSAWIVSCAYALAGFGLLARSARKERTEGLTT